ncbi:hypothetical protein BT69DRAFT_1338345 [Atractiella rhizophila]|nr:hypothetical protein BT69DRAFT_1338345 [Atractiella rhizophila]
MVSKEFVQQIFAHCEKNEWDEFCTYLDPDVRWWINDDKEDDYTHTGIYNVASWKEKVGVPLWARLKDGVNTMKISSLNVFGNLSIVECIGNATQKNGQPFAWFFVFDEETGKVKEIREYMNTAHVADVMRNNEP